MRANSMFGRFLAKIAPAGAILLLSLVGFAGTAAAQVTSEVSKYVIGPGDQLQVSVWHNPELSSTVPVRPDGRISTPLVTDIVAAGRTPEQLGHEIEAQLKKYVSDPLVTVIVTSFVGPYNQQVRIVGEATTPKSLAYMAHMTVLDAMIAVGGLTPYASGNRAKLVRHTGGKEVSTTLRLSDLLKDGDLSANADLQPGDIIIIPQSFF
ncbi:MAG TPA: XrtA/PEP-CTERM system exopolysaccharide export protein [Rhizomicrobium sp.]|nr:XrtA/PEP-CTERM system exopolysaccharide export protein [Rhizomicrobium sp.]